MMVGLFVISQSVYLKPEPPKDSQEQSDEEIPEAAQIVNSEAVTTTPLQVNLGFQSYLLEEIGQAKSEKRQVFSLERFLPSFSKALKVLFSRIISPNAP